MYVIRDTTTKAILEMVPSAPGETRRPEEIYPDFDPEKMEFGKSDEPGIPAWFTIENGVVKPAERPDDPHEVDTQPPAKPATPTLEETKASAIKYFSDLSFELRRALIPDYQLQNAALGVYDEQRTAAIRDTVKAFRDEFYRLKTAIEQARSLKALKGLTPSFPTQVVVAGAASSTEPARPAEPVPGVEPAPAVEPPTRIPVRRPRPPGV